MSKKHVKESKRGLKHIYRHTDPCGKGGADCDYEKRFVGEQVVKKPPSFPGTGYGRHHIIPVGSVGRFETFDAYDRSQRKAIRDVYRETKWCSSHEENIVVLPLKSTYARTRADRVRGLGLPCHDVDHGCAQGYTDEVTVAIEARIWRKFKKASDTGHPQPEQVRDDLEDLEGYFKKRLDDRGMRAPGTAAAIAALAPRKNKKDEAARREEVEKNASWLPLSMAKDRVARLRRLLSLGEVPDWFAAQLESRYPRPKKKK
jgi:hypothetical protein